jgi:hypothetical protein
MYDTIFLEECYSQEEIETIGIGDYYGSKMDWIIK